MEVKKEEVYVSNVEIPSLKEEEQELDLVFAEHSVEIAHVLDADKDEEACSGIDPDGSRWWKEKGVERRPDGVICRWTMIRGVKVDQDVEWQEKFWEAADEFGYKELGSEKSGRDATGNVWREYWRESMWQVGYGHGGSMKHTDKWAEDCEGDGWTKWGDKWDEHFDPNGHGVKQGETWWGCKQFGERWNCTWGERHNGSRWVHKYGKSSSGERWDTHEQQETWYERFPHYGFYHCFENSPQLKQVQNPSEIQP